MPGFISHTVMANDIYTKLKLNVNKEYLVTYSLGGDLSKYSKCRKATHHQKQDDFIYALADYIKDNNLENDKTLLGVLYGHIAHYIMDDTIHPLVRIVSKKCNKNKNNHTLVELYYDNYLTNHILNKSVDSYLRKSVLNAKRNKQIKKMLNSTYKKVYNTNHISIYYNFNLFLYRLLSLSYRLLSFNKIAKISQLNSFITTNKDIDIINEKKQITYINYNKNESNLDLIGLYNTSIKRTTEYINKINKYLKIWQIQTNVLLYLAKKEGILVMINRDIKLNNGNIYTYEIKAMNNNPVSIGSNYKLVKFYKTKKSFKDTLLGSDVGASSNGFASIIAISLIIAIYSIAVMLISFRI